MKGGLLESNILIVTKEKSSLSLSHSTFVIVPSSSISHLFTNQTRLERNQAGTLKGSY